MVEASVVEGVGVDFPIRHRATGGLNRKFEHAIAPLALAAELDEVVGNGRTLPAIS